MNDSNTQRSEKIAAKILRVLAVIGLVAVLALASWVIVRGTQSVPAVRESMSAAVTAIQSIFTSAPEESLIFELEERTVPVGKKTTLAWNYTGETMPESYLFSYTCGTAAELTMVDNEGWHLLTCGEKYKTSDQSITVTAANTKTRFADLELMVAANELTDTTVISIVNTDITADTESTDTATASSNTTTETVASNTNTNTVPTTAAPIAVTTPTQGQSTQTVIQRTTVPVYTGPADLVVNIEETGVILDVDGEDTFFPVDEIPTDKVAGVVFTVTNRGGETSEIWTFDATLPIEGDDEYEYTSPKQMPLASGMEIRFTLGFDELLEENDGKITIELDPNNDDDKTSNNEDSVVIDIDVK